MGFFQKGGFSKKRLFRKAGRCTGGSINPYREHTERPVFVDSGRRNMHGATSR